MDDVRYCNKTFSAPRQIPWFFRFSGLRLRAGSIILFPFFRFSLLPSFVYNVWSRPEPLLCTLRSWPLSYFYMLAVVPLFNSQFHGLVLSERYANYVLPTSWKLFGSTKLCALGPFLHPPIHFFASFSVNLFLYSCGFSQVSLLFLFPSPSILYIRPSSPELPPSS